MSVRERILTLFRLFLLFTVLVAVALISAITTIRLTIHSGQETMPDLVGRPLMIPCRAQLASVLGSVNGILLVGSKGGNTLVTGRGAGGEPTGVAVVSDVVQIARDIVAGGRTAT
ncbi:MAG: hypothetical protein DMG24_23580, partial [Acidobacteria bacterium]